MIDFFQIPDLFLFFLLSFIAIFVSIAAIILVKIFVPFKVLHEENAVIGTVSALISLIYGVLAGLTALYLINNISFASDAVQREADAVANIYRSSKWLPEDVHSKIKKEMINYLNTVIQVEWPLMKTGSDLNHDGDKLIDQLSNVLREFIISHQLNTAQNLISADLLDEIKNLYNAREQRIHMSEATLTPELWIVIIIGTILTIGINYLYGMNLYLHAVTVSAAALMAVSIVYLLLTLDQPFQGESIVKSEPLSSVLNIIQGDKPSGLIVPDIEVQGQPQPS